jgi:predicted ArsR family transcriptional regulator
MIRDYNESQPLRLARLLATLPPGRRRVAQALIADRNGTTYAAVAARIGVHPGTVARHLHRLRRRHPHVYQVLMAVRTSQLAERHERALARAEEHTARWRAWQQGQRSH